MNWLQKLIIRRPKNRKRKPSRSRHMRPFKRSRIGWAELDYQEAITYWTRSQGAR